MKRTPCWFSDVDSFLVAEAFELAVLRQAATGIAWHVDHIIPLQSRKACGLHCADNLQVIPAGLNIAKGNRMLFAAPGEWIAVL